MGNPGIPEDECWRRYRAWMANGKNFLKAAKAIGTTDKAVKRAVVSLSKAGLVDFTPPQPPPGFEIKSRSVMMRDGETERETIRYGPESGPEFEMPEGRRLGKATVQIGPDNRVERQWVRHDDEKLDPVAMAEVAREQIAKMAWIRPRPIDRGSETNADLLTIYPVADLHLALRATKEESGEDYNLDIAAGLFSSTSLSLVERSPIGGTALVAYLGDWTHQDDDKNMTPRSGHILQVSNDLFTTVRTGVGLALQHIHHVRARHDHVIVKVMRANHDPHAYIGLVLALEQHFRDDPNVTVDTSMADYWFFRWGLIGSVERYGNQFA